MIYLEKTLKRKILNAPSRRSAVFAMYAFAADAGAGDLAFASNHKETTRTHVRLQSKAFLASSLLLRNGNSEGPNSQKGGTRERKNSTAVLRHQHNKAAAAAAAAAGAPATNFWVGTVTWSAHVEVDIPKLLIQIR